MLDQGTSSVTNVLLNLAVARQASPEVYAKFAIAVATVAGLLTVTRQSVGAYLVAISGSRAGDDPAFRVDGALFAQSMFALLAVVAPIVLLVGSVGAQSAGPVIAMAIAGPVVVLQDGLRYLTMSRGKPGPALASDLLWLGVFVAGWFLSRGSATPALWSVAAWGGGAIVGYAWLSFGLRHRPSATAFPRWWRAERRAFTRLLGDGVLAALTPLGIVAIIGTELPLVQSGAYLAATVLFGPVNVLITLFALVLSMELERVTDRSRAIRVFLAVAVATGLLTGVFVALLLLLPQSWGVSLLGATWSSARPVLPFRGIETIAAALLAVLYAYWRWDRRYRAQLRSRLLLVVATLCAVGSGCLWAGTGRAVAAFSAAVACVVLAVSVGLGWRGTSRPVASEDSHSGVAPEW